MTSNVKKSLNGRGDFLFEIGCEEIPAGMIVKACRELKALLEKYFVANALLDEGSAASSIETFGAPRRLTAIVKNVRLKQEDVVREITGPPKAVAYDAVGEPTRAAMSFAEKQGMAVSKLSIIMTPKGEYLAAKQEVLGKPAAQILAGVLPQVIQEISWPRSMYWTGLGKQRFIRPIRWIVALLDGKVVPFAFADVVSGAHTEGHRFLGSSKIALSGPQDYEPKLKKNFVLCRPAARSKKIETEIAAITKKHAVKVHHDEHLLEMVTYLNEYPSVIIGDFDPAYLALPDEILLTVMRDHQKYFGLKLKAVTYESRLGSYGDKVERMRALARWLAEQWFSAGVSQADVAGSDRAAELAKCDLVTEMVREL